MSNPIIIWQEFSTKVNFIQAGKTRQNALVENLNRKLKIAELVFSLRYMKKPDGK